jgi:hypothetical protein
MILFRKRLRLLSAAWMLFQVTSLSTLVPRACCLAHQHQAQPPDCHGASAQAEAPAPMHHSHGHVHEQAVPASQAPAHECTLRGTCGGPAAALLALLSIDGVLTDPNASPVDLDLAGKALPSTDQLTPQFEPPDAPPPRA